MINFESGLNEVDDSLLPKDWESGALADFSIIEGGGKSGLTKQADYVSFGYPAFSAAGKDGFVEKPDYVNKAAVVLSSIGANCGKCFYIYGSFAALANTQVIFPNHEKVDAQFLFYIVNRINYWERSGSAQPFIKPSHIKKSRISYPKLINEQTTIARILSKVDEAIAQTEQLIAKYTRIKTGLMQDLLTKGIDEHGNIRSEQSHEFKDSPLGRIPKEWECVKLIDIGSKTSPYLKTGPFGSSLKSEHWKETGIPVITIGSLGESAFIKENLLYVSSDKANELNVYKLNVGDILFSRVADIGRSLVIQNENDGWIMSSNFMRLRLNKEIYNPFILNLIIKHSEAFLKQVAQNVPESGRSVTNSKILNSFIFPKIPMPEQEKVMILYSKMGSQINSTAKQLTKLQSLKTGLMQDLLSGKVRVNHLMKETASV